MIDWKKNKFEGQRTDGWIKYSQTNEIRRFDATAVMQRLPYA